jgi:hypothetical protein
LMWRGPDAMHTRGDTLVYVDEDRVLFTGDVVMSQRFLAAQNNSSVQRWVEVLSELEVLKPLHVVPSHGRLGDATLITQASEFIGLVMRMTRELKREAWTMEDVVAAVVKEIAPKFPEFGNPVNAGAMARAAYAEALLEETITVTTDHDLPPMTSTPEEELDRLRDKDAIAVVDVQSVRGERMPGRIGARTVVRGKVTVGVRASDLAALWNADGTIEFAFEGGEFEDVKRGQYPPLTTGERYLIFFDLHPAGERWYPSMPFRVDEAGRLDQVEFIPPSRYGWKSPINRMPLKDVVTGLQKK